MPIYLETENGILYHGDCMEHFGKIRNGAVDMVLCDLPYGITECKWDTKIPLAPLWDQWGRILKENGTVCLTAQQPFVTELINSTKRPFRFRYELIWEKAKRAASSTPTVCRCGRMKISLFSIARCHDTCRRCPKGVRTAQKAARRKIIYLSFRWQKTATENHGTRFPRSVLRFATESHTEHPTEKPQALFEWLIRTYTIPGETVVDNCMGGGTTAAAAEATGRRWIGMEVEDRWCEATEKRLVEMGIEISKQLE